MRLRNRWLGITVLLIVALFALAAVGLAAGTGRTPASVQVPVTPVTYPGVYMAGNYLNHVPPIIDRLRGDWPIEGVLVTINWAYIEDTVPGQYDWSKMDEVLAWAGASGKKVAILFSTYNGWADGGVVNALPRYLWDPNNPYYADYQDWPAYVDAGEWRCAGEPDRQGCVTGYGPTPHWLYPRYWSDTYLERYEQFIRAFGARYGNDPRIEFVAIGAGMYGEIHAVDYGTDLVDHMKNAILQDLANRNLFCEPACTDERSVWIAVVKRLIDVYTEAMPQKVQFAQTATFTFSPAERVPIARHVNSKNGRAGLSINNMYPNWVGAYVPTAYGDQGYFGQFPLHGHFSQEGNPDHEFPTAMEGYWYWLACEGKTDPALEEVGIYWALLQSLDKHVDYWRLNYDLFMTPDGTPKPALVSLIEQWKPFLGRSLTDPNRRPPAVFVALREFRAPYVPCWWSRTSPPWQGYPEIGDYEYWLYHDRTIPGGRSVPETAFPTVETWSTWFPLQGLGNPNDPTNWYPMPDAYNPKLPKTKESWVTRRTDEANGQRRMYFKIDDNYLHDVPPGTPITITVTFLDDAGDTWALVYDGQSGPTALVVTNEDPGEPGLGGGYWAEIQFVITDGRFANGLTGGADFYLDSQGDGDNWFHMVMVSKGPAPAQPTPIPSPTPTPTPEPTPTPTPTPTTARVEGKVFFDADQDGTPDAGEPGVAGARVTLLLNGSQPVGTPVVTDRSGQFTFTGLQPGFYVLTLDPPAGYRTTTVPSYAGYLSAGMVQTDWNFGLYATRLYVPNVSR